MSQVNRVHIYILAFVSVLMFILYFKREEYKTNINNMLITVESLEKNGVKLTDLRNRWDSKNVKESIQKYLENITQKGKTRKTGSRISYQFDDISKSEFDKHVKKIFQASTEVTRFSVERNNDFNLSFNIELEIGR
jgi:hypothetical protein